MSESKYYRVTLSYEVLVEAEENADVHRVAAQAIEQEQVRTGIRYRVTAIDNIAVDDCPDDLTSDPWDEL